VTGFVPYQELAGIPNIIVDGSAAGGTLITLSHWPHSGTPTPLKDDLSTQIVFRYLKAPEFHVEAAAVSNNHFDEDGLAGLYAILHPEDALALEPLLVDVAAAGDFGTYRFPEAARAVFVLSAFADPDLSPFGGALFARPYPEVTALLYRETLPRLPEILRESDRFRDFWIFEQDLLDASEKAIRSGEITIRELPLLDLAVVELPEALPGRSVHRFTQKRHAACHPMALHNATHCFRVLLVQGRCYELQYRYESWVQHISRRPLPRVDLEPLALRLTEQEKNGGRWEFDGVGEITPRLRLAGAEESAIPPDLFLRQVADYLETAPPAWDPYDP